MRIGLYPQPSGGAFGGTDVLVAILAEAFARNHEVEILHHGSGVTPESVAEFAGTDLRGVRIRHMMPVVESSDSHNPVRRYRQARAPGRGLSEGYDLFVAFVHDPPPFCYADRGVLVVLFPMFTPYHRAPREAGSSGFWDTARRAYASLEWRRRIASYGSVIAISEYTREWVRRLWDSESTVLHPPAGGDISPDNKSPLLLSVGRFAATGHVKCQLEMVSAFAGLDLEGWEYVSAGALGKSFEDQAYAAAVRNATAKRPITIATNLDRAAVRTLFGRAKIFWHAAGLANTGNAPDLNEHFGLTTIEAMAGGCVPVVINKGGQPEIVEHGVSGFLWNTVEELQDYTRALARDELLWARMSTAARERSREFDRARYVDGFLRLIGVQN